MINVTSFLAFLHMAVTTTSCFSVLFLFVSLKKRNCRHRLLRQPNTAGG